jgi:hypothetical protein
MSDLFDKAKNLLAENADTVEDVVDKIAGFVDDQTGGKHRQQVRDGADKAKDAIAKFAGGDDAAAGTAEHGGKPETTEPEGNPGEHD